MTVSLLETCRGCDGSGLADGDVDGIAGCYDCLGEGKVFIGFGDDRPTLVARLMLDYLITDNKVSPSIDRMARALMQELEDYEIDEAVEAEERRRDML